MNTVSQPDTRTNRPGVKDDQSSQKQQHQKQSQHHSHQQPPPLPPPEQLYIAGAGASSSFSSSSRSSSGYIYPTEASSYDGFYTSTSGTTTSTSLHSHFDHDDSPSGDFLSYEKSLARPSSLETTKDPTFPERYSVHSQLSSFQERHPSVQQQHHHQRSFQDQPQHHSLIQQPKPHSHDDSFHSQKQVAQQPQQPQPQPQQPQPQQHEQQEQKRTQPSLPTSDYHERMYESDNDGDDDDDDDDEGFDLDLDLDPEQLQHPLLLEQYHSQQTTSSSSSTLPQQVPLPFRQQHQQQQPQQQHPRPQSSHEFHSNNFITEEEFLMLAEDYLLSLSPKKREKALLSNIMYQKILMVLLQPKNTQVSTAQFRFWAKKMFTLSTTATHHIVCHGGKPVATKECLYDVLVYCHRKSAHGGRDKTSAEVRQHYSWVPKELIARFVKHCPLCSSRRYSLQRPLSSSGVPSGSMEFSSSQHGRESSQFQGPGTEFSSSSYPSSQYLTHASHHGAPYPSYEAQHHVFSQYRQLQQHPRPSSQQTVRQESLQMGGASLRRYHEVGPFRHGYRRSSQSDALPVSSRSVLQSPYSNDSYSGRDWGGRSQFADETGPGDESDNEDDILMHDDNDFNEPDEDCWQRSFLKHHHRDTGHSISSGGDLDDDEFTPSGMVGIPQEIRPFSGAPRRQPHRAASFDLHYGLRLQQHQGPLSSNYHHSHGQGPGPGPGPGSGLPSQGQELRQYPDAPLPMAHHPNGHLIHGRQPIHNRPMLGAGLEYPRYTGGSSTMAFSQPKASHHGLHGPWGTLQRSVSSGLDYGTFTRGDIDGPRVDDPPDEHPGAKDAREQMEREGDSARMDQDEVEHGAG